MLKIDPTGNSAMASFESNYKESPVVMLPAGGSSSLYLFCFALQSTVAVSFWPAYGKTYPILLLLRLRPIFRFQKRPAPWDRSNVILGWWPSVCPGVG